MAPPVPAIGKDAVLRLCGPAVLKHLATTLPSLLQPCHVCSSEPVSALVCALNSAYSSLAGEWKSSCHIQTGAAAECLDSFTCTTILCRSCHSPNLHEQRREPLMLHLLTLTTHLIETVCRMNRSRI